MQSRMLCNNRECTHYILRAATENDLRAATETKNTGTSAVYSVDSIQCMQF